MRPITSTTARIKSTKKNDDEIIILKFNNSDDEIEQLILEMQEEENLARENAAFEKISEIKMINKITINELSRVA